ncbi:hypothetical protein E2542_SST13636 [Spatholobus suberectus]|nr:hypothetical protein E2542_SST13636 [Spatholobus suberectus]
MISMPTRGYYIQDITYRINGTSASKLLLNFLANHVFKHHICHCHKNPSIRYGEGVTIQESISIIILKFQRGEKVGVPEGICYGGTKNLHSSIGYERNCQTMCQDEINNGAELLMIKLGCLTPMASKLIIFKLNHKPNDLLHITNE